MERIGKDPIFKKGAAMSKKKPNHPLKEKLAYRRPEEKAPANYPVPENIPKVPRFKCILADPPYSKYNHSTNCKYGTVWTHYDLMSLDRLKAMPVIKLADDNAHLWLWTMSNAIDEALELVRAWGFKYITTFTWVKPRLGVGNYLRTCTEICLFCVRGKMPPKNRNVMNWLMSYPTSHSEKPRQFVPIIEKVSEGPYLELFCRKRPASNQKWYCWGAQCEGGSDLFIPDYPVPQYSWKDNGVNETPVVTDGNETKVASDENDETNGNEAFVSGNGDDENV